MKSVHHEKRILLVDDEPDIRDVLQMALTDTGYRVHLAANGQEALDLFNRIRPPIVITDIKMPVMDGIELLQEIKRCDPETEVLMITGHGDMDLAIKSLKNAATDFITKPINMDALEIALQRTNEKILMREKLKAYTENLETLLRQKSELQDHLSRLGLMVSSISHGIKGLLTALDGGVYLLESGLAHQDAEKIGQGRQTVKLMAARIRKMVMDILFYAKKRELACENIDVLEFAGQIAASVAPRLEGQPVDFVCRLAPDAGKLHIDPAYVQAALMNIIENAIDACGRDTTKGCHRIVFSVDSRKDDIIFGVADDGVGMDAATQEKLFSVFFSSKGRRGTGLGLFIANQIVCQHGGEIRVNSAPGHGSRFRIQLPRKKPPAGHAESETAG